MGKMVCPYCGAEMYSADTTSKYWICWRCGKPVPKEE